MTGIPNPIPLPLKELVPLPSLFVHRSRIHGQRHVARVLVHAFVLLDRAGRASEAAPLWAGVYLHDLARRHDGVCHEHGANAVRRLAGLSALQALFERGGVRRADYPAIEMAVTHHCRPRELARNHPYWRLTALLKDADGLDRVRLGDLEPRYLRFPESRSLVLYAQRLYDVMGSDWPEGEDCFERLWPTAQRLMSHILAEQARQRHAGV